MDEQLTTQPAPTPKYDYSDSTEQYRGIIFNAAPGPFGSIPGVPLPCETEPNEALKEIIRTICKQNAANVAFKHLRDVVRGL